MDIQYLLFLQNIRETYVPFLIHFMEMVSYFAISYILFIPAYIYWVKDKKAGHYILTAWSVANALNATVKLTACVYRPWIRDPRVVPAGNAIATAGGYSFPSGHSTWASSLYGSTAYYCRRIGKKALMVVLILLVFLTMFSRNFLGVHTPQDVLVGMTEGFVMTLLIAKLYDKTEENHDLMDKCLLAGAILSILAIIYILVKPYPMTYVDGKLLVDPVKMRYDGIQDISALTAMMLWSYVDKRWIRFEPVEIKNFQKSILAAAGVGLYLVISYLKSSCINTIGPNAGRVAYSFLLYFYMIILVPLVLKSSAEWKKSPFDQGNTV